MKHLTKDELRSLLTVARSHSERDWLMILVAYWHMFTNGETYRELGGDYYQRRDPERLTKRLVARLQSLGHQVTLTPTPATA